LIEEFVQRIILITIEAAGNIQSRELQVQSKIFKFHRFCRKVKIFQRVHDEYRGAQEKEKQEEMGKERHQERNQNSFPDSCKVGEKEGKVKKSEEK